MRTQSEAFAVAIDTVGQQATSTSPTAGPNCLNVAQEGPLQGNWHPPYMGIQQEFLNLYGYHDRRIMFAAVSSKPKNTRASVVSHFDTISETVGGTSDIGTASPRARCSAILIKKGVAATMKPNMPRTQPATKYRGDSVM
eukprot:CAMPEP_0206427626 /NCGR_PEP_ID=MMETSP0324_2-20121206/5155_1 /ASSEMBLY_ACC=CAM_ASM_000836 /TAXON_ID=2866 /ORGANISM="Crypthecodinium cohnii, Strain Seligo" /LENGTH=139 /DNA_ID=CAMNT_0053892947 /DNA_START=553 /DNA_END=972 /DNA_ORIENTATION=-